MTKKITVLVMAFILFISLLSIENHNVFASVKDSPTSDYRMHPNKDRISLYRKPKGKKIYTINKIIYEPGNPISIPQAVYVKKFYKNGWARISYKEQYTKKKSPSKTYKGYVKISNLTYNVHDFVSVFVYNTKGGTLKKTPNKKSKNLATVPLGTLVDIDHANNDGVLYSDNNNFPEFLWVRVEYYKNGKKYIGWLSYKDARS